MADKLVTPPAKMTCPEDVKATEFKTKKVGMGGTEGKDKLVDVARCLESPADCDGMWKPTSNTGETGTTKSIGVGVDFVSGQSVPNVDKRK